MHVLHGLDCGWLKDFSIFKRRFLGGAILLMIVCCELSD